MEDKMLRRQIRRSFHPVGWSLVIYYLIMNGAVAAVVFVDVLLRMIEGMTSGTMPDVDELMTLAVSNGWGYLLAGAIGLAVLFLWKGKAFWKEEIWAKGKPMKPGAFFAILTVFIGCQMAATIGNTVIEWILNQFGLSAMAALESAAMEVNTLSLFLYMAIWAPIFEEILFRGLVQRLLLPYGKRFAIFGSAFLFGMYHGNLMQSPYAILAGLVLGYVASEYSIAWAMLLHMINNLVLGVIMVRLTEPLGEEASSLIIWCVLNLAAIGGSVGALLGMYTFRHKTRHVKFTVGIPVIMALQIALAVAIFIHF